MNDAFIIMIAIKDIIKQKLKYLLKNIATIIYIVVVTLALSTCVMIFDGGIGVSSDTYEHIITKVLWYDDITEKLVSYIEDDGILNFDEYYDIVRLLDLKKIDKIIYKEENNEEDNRFN